MRERTRITKADIRVAPFCLCAGRCKKDTGRTRTAANKLNPSASAEACEQSEQAALFAAAMDPMGQGMLLLRKSLKGESRLCVDAPRGPCLTARSHRCRLPPCRAFEKPD